MPICELNNAGLPKFPKSDTDNDALVCKLVTIDVSRNKEALIAAHLRRIEHTQKTAA